MELKKMNRTALIVAALLAIILIGSIITSIVGEGKDKDEDAGFLAGTESTITDTRGPDVKMKQRYIFTNDLTKLTDVSSLVENKDELSDCTFALVRFEKKAALFELHEVALKNLTEKADCFVSKEAAMEVGSEEIPSEEGIYRAVMEIMDEHGNASYEEVVLILDKTGAKIEDVADKEVKVSKENLSAEPAIDKSEYGITDNVDGKIKADDIVCELELRDEAKHEWLVHVSYVDRAGNESKATFLITVKEDTVSDTQSGNANTGNSGSVDQSGNAGNGGSTSNGGTTNNGGTSNNGGNSNAGNNANTGSGNNTGNNTNTESNKKPVNNQDASTWVPTEDEHDISPYEQMVIDAGYGNVVDFGDGDYAVLTHGDGYANGKHGFEILTEYLKNLGLKETSMNGGFIDSRYDWYMYIAKDTFEFDYDSGNEWTGDGEIEFID